MCRSLQDILSDLHDYHSQQQQWVRLQERLTWEQAPFEVQLAGYTSEKLSAIMANRGQRCVQRNSDDSKPMITCDFTENHVATNLQVDITLSLQRLLRNVESETQKITEQMSKSKRDFSPMPSRKNREAVKEKVRTLSTVSADAVQEDGVNMPPVTHQKYPSVLSTSSDKYFDVRGWPTKDECENWNLPVREHDELDIPVFLPPENKGFQ